MRPWGAIAALIGLVATVVPARGDIWVWRDRMGVSHYTNALENVPAEYRASAMTVAKDWERAEPPPEPQPAPEPQKATAPEPAAAPEAAPAASGTQSTLESVDAFAEGMRAGLRAAEAASATAIASSTVVPVVQLFAPEPELHHVHGLVPFAPHRPIPPMKPPRGDHRDADEPRRFQGPGGPPPLGAAGPPPFQP